MRDTTSHDQAKPSGNDTNPSVRRRVVASINDVVEDERGQATLFDFLQSMVIRMAAITAFVFIGLSLIFSSAGGAPSDQITAQRGANTLADDILVTTPGDAELDRSCTEAFFDQRSGVCGYSNSWGNGANEYLNDALGIQQRKNIHAGLYDTSGNEGTINGVTLAIGDEVPDNDEIDQWERHVGLDADGDGTMEWFTLRVTVWR